jgi:YD repeat-containing protein
MKHRSLPRTLLATALVLVAGCRDMPLPTAAAPDRPRLAIVDGTEGGNPYFHWLPPMVPSASYSGTFDGGPSPVVRIYECAGRNCASGTLIATSGVELPRVRVVTKKGEESYFQTRWATDAFALDVNNTYRVVTHIGSAVLGHADVWLGNNKKELASVNSTQFVPLVAGAMLEINFRIEMGALTDVVATVEVSPASVTIEEAGTQQLTATLRNAAGATISGPVTWSSSNAGVATVSSSGLVTGVAEGSAVITATSQGVSANASVTVEDASGQIRGETIAAGYSHSCGLTTAGAAYCWGDNSGGQVGDGTTGTPALTPVAVAGGLTFEQLSAGLIHTCGLTAAGAAYCWGNNDYGQLGDGAGISRSTPVAVSGGLTFTQLSAGWIHTCGVTTTGAAYCWGDNSGSQIGDGTTNTWVPAPVAVLGGLTFDQISAGAAHTVGLTAEGAAYGWGGNNYGQLGDGTTIDRSTPVVVSGGLTFEQLSAGFGHTMGLTTAGAAYSWGYNQWGQLGEGTTTNRSTPTAVQGGLTFGRLSAGQSHSLGMTSSGAAYAWGSNAFGRLGDGTGIDSSTPVAVSGGLTFTQLSAGGGHSVGVTAARVAYAWGINTPGALGDGTTTHRSTPVVVSGGLTFR